MSPAGGWLLRGRGRCCGAAVGGVSAREIEDSHRNVAVILDFREQTIGNYDRYPNRFDKIFFRIFPRSSVFSGIPAGIRWIRESGSLVVQTGSRMRLSRALAEAVRIGIGGIPGAVESVEGGVRGGGAEWRRWEARPAKRLLAELGLGGPGGDRPGCHPSLASNKTPSPRFPEERVDLPSRFGSGLRFDDTLEAVGFRRACSGSGRLG